MSGTAAGGLAGGAPGEEYRGALGAIAPALLEYWFRDRYFETRIDISSSGVENYTLGELRALLEIPFGELDTIAFRDSPSRGSEELGQAIRAHVAPESRHAVVATHGSSEAIFLAMAALLRPGDQVVIPRPGYQSLTSTVAALGAEPVAWPLAQGQDFAPDLDELERLLTPYTRMVVANFPHNPTGASLDAGAYLRFVELIDSSPCYLLWDASLAMMAYEGNPLPDPSCLLERCVSTGTLSKAYGLPGLRVGWCLAPEDVACSMVRVRDYTTLNTSPLSEYLATAVLRHTDRVLGPRVRQAEENRRIVMAWARRHAEVVQCPPPRGGVTVFPRIDGLTSTRPLCERLLTERGVLLVPGDCFGYPDRVRLGFGGPSAELVAGLDELASAIADARDGADAA